MCGSPKVDNTIQNQMLADSARARQDEEARAGRIRTGTADIDRTFEGFGDDFFNGFRDNIMDYQQPQLDDQFGDAQDELTFALTRAGTLNSSMAGQKRADLTSAYTDNLASLLNDAEGQTGDLRGRVANEKSSLTSLLNATGDAQRSANEATSRSRVLFEQQPRFNPLPAVFQGAATGVGNFVEQRQRSQVLDAYFGGSPTGSAPRSNTRVIGSRA
jgi:hypothetical protein